jgi:AAA+ superfamily predicted ATPase
MAELTAMVGLESAKEVISKAIAKFKLDKLCMDRGIQRDRGSMHMVFTGNPGTAKTTVARLCAEILSDEKILTTGSFVEVGRADLVGAHVGETAQIVKKRFREAQGGVLFIDEAYSLCDSLKGGYGDEAINTIVQEMENHREDTLVIFAGYPGPMKEFLDRNPGMKSRIAFHVTFKDYTTDELCKITELMASKKNIAITEKAMDKLRSDFESARVNDDYGNGRYVRKLLEEAEMNLANRVVQMPENELTAEIITTIEACDIPDFKPDGRTKHRIGFAS